MKTLNIGRSIDGTQFKLQLNLTTQTVAILGKKGSGKSFTASVFAEELMQANQQLIAIDPTGAWWGLKSSSDGERPAFPVVVFGGDHADIPLEETAGHVIAETLVQKKVSAILDLSLMGKGQMKRFLADYFATLYRLNREPVHLMCDECDIYAPQRCFGDDARVLGAMEDIVRRGRRKGIGCTLISQRPQVVSKDVLTQCEMLVALRLSHPRDMAAVREWIEVHADEGEADKLMQSLPDLPVGDAWFWEPGEQILDRVTVRKRTTFDSGATPKPGQVALKPRALAAVDVKALGEEIASTVERVKADDPKLLKARIAELERSKPGSAQRVEVPMMTPSQEGLILAALTAVEEFDRALKAKAENVSEIARDMKGLYAELKGRVPPKDVNITPPTHSLLKRIATIKGLSFPKAEGKILTALAQYGACAKNKVAALTGYAVTGGSFNNALSALRNHDLGALISGGGDMMEITQLGLDALGAYEPLPTGEALLKMWVAELPKAEREILQCLYRVSPQQVTKEELARAVGYTAAGGSFNNALSYLRTLELITRGKQISITPDIFR